MSEGPSRPRAILTFVDEPARLYGTSDVDGQSILHFNPYG